MGNLNRINGYDVVASTNWRKQPGLLPARVIMGRRNNTNDYVVSTQTADRMPGDADWKPHGEWTQGHYFTDFNKAAAKFVELWHRHVE